MHLWSQFDPHVSLASDGFLGIIIRCDLMQDPLISVSCSNLPDHNIQNTEQICLSDHEPFLGSSTYLIRNISSRILEIYCESLMRSFLKVCCRNFTYGFTWKSSKNYISVPSSFLQLIHMVSYTDNLCFSVSSVSWPPCSSPIFALPSPQSFFSSTWAPCFWQMKHLHIFLLSLSNI